MTLKKIIFLSLIGLLAVTLLISGIFFFVINKDPNNDESVKEYHIYKINELYTNIKDSKNILKVNITIEYNNKELYGILEKNKDKITNDILELLRSKTFEDFSGKTGQQTARNNILSLIKEIINSEEVSNVYFTEFIIQ